MLSPIDKRNIIVHTGSFFRLGPCLGRKWVLLDFTQKAMGVKGENRLSRETTDILFGCTWNGSLTRWNVGSQTRWNGYQGLDARETPYSNSGSKNGCASGPHLVRPHRIRKESSRDFLTKFRLPKGQKKRGAFFLRPTSRPETGSPALLGFLPTTLCRGVIWTHFSRVAPDWNLWRALYSLSYSATASG